IPWSVAQHGEAIRLQGYGSVTIEDVGELAVRIAAIRWGDDEGEDAIGRCGWAGRLAEARRWLAGEVLDDAPARDRQDEIEDAARALVLAAAVRDEMMWLRAAASAAEAVVAEATRVLVADRPAV